MGKGWAAAEALFKRGGESAPSNVSDGAAGLLAKMAEVAISGARVASLDAGDLGDNVDDQMNRVRGDQTLD